MSETTEHDDLELVTTLQDAVQPTGVPVLPRFDLDACCRVSSGATESGGSWFDVVVLPDDRIALVAGETPGMGLTPTVTAAQVRAVIRAGLRRDGDVVSALHLADIHAEDVADARGTTAVVVLLDADRGLATYANAGHQPPLLLPAGGRATFLSDTGGGPLGTGAGTGYAAATCALSPEDGVLLVGASALRTAPATRSQEQGHDWAEQTFGTIQRTGDAIAEQMAVDDTLVLVAARLRPSAPRRLAVVLNGETDPNRRARQELDAWLTELDASPIDHMALTHAAAELVTNALQHAGEDGRVELRATLGSDARVLIEVTDGGSWQAPPGDLDRGRGLAMAAGLVDHLAVAVRPTGTRAVLQHRLVRPVLIEAVDHTGGHLPAGELEVVHAGPQAVSLVGTFAHDEVERVAAELLVASRGGTVPLSLDLRGVIRLSTSAVRLLADLTSVNHAVGRFSAPIEITSSAGSVSQQALENARVPHHAV